MLSYQHGYHAGNHADVLKHAVLCWVIDYLLQKDKPFYFHDTHGGRGLYTLQHPMAQKTGEYKDGILRIWNKPDLPAALLPYINTLKTFNTEGGLRYYAGSSLLAQRMMRGIDRLAANELHPQEFLALRDNAEFLHNLRVTKEDGYQALKAAMPPKERRGLVLIDPSYELPEDDKAVVQSLREALQRFPTGIYMVWYPVVDAARARKLAKNVAALVPVEKFLQLELLVREPQKNATGMAGSGMLLINPPWQLAAVMQDVLPWLEKCCLPTQQPC